MSHILSQTYHCPKSQEMRLIWIISGQHLLEVFNYKVCIIISFKVPIDSIHEMMIWPPHCFMCLLCQVITACNVEANFEILKNGGHNGIFFAKPLLPSYIFIFIFFFLLSICPIPNGNMQIAICNTVSLKKSKAKWCSRKTS